MSNKCFVMMPFKEPFTSYYQLIYKPAIENAGFEATNAGEVYGVRPIIEDILAGIREATALLADVTGSNANVNYELGIAHALQRPVIIITQSLDDIPFDYKHLRVIKYDLTKVDWASELKNNITNTLKNIEIKPILSPGKDPKLFATSGDFGTASAWLQLLQNTNKEFDLMGIALTAWKRTPRFWETIIDKAKQGCRVRILLMHEQNPALKGLVYEPKGESLGGGISAIRDSVSFFQKLASESNKITVRQMERGTPHFFLTRTDQQAILVQYLYSEVFGNGPLWQCTRESVLYSLIEKEFNTLWEVNR